MATKYSTIGRRIHRRPEGASANGDSGESGQGYLPFSRRNFAAEAHRQSLAVACSLGEKDDQAFVDSIAEGMFSEFFDE